MIAERAVVTSPDSRLPQSRQQVIRYLVDSGGRFLGLGDVEAVVPNKIGVADPVLGALAIEHGNGFFPLDHIALG